MLHGGILFLLWSCKAKTFRFTFEFLLRLSVSTDRKAFIKKPLNAVDAITIIPFYIDLFVGATFGSSDNFSKVSGTLCPCHFFFSSFRVSAGALFVLRVLRVARVARVFKVARYSSSLQVIGETLLRSASEVSCG